MGMSALTDQLLKVTDDTVQQDQSRMLQDMIPARRGN